MANDFSSSDVGFQVAAPSVECQTPPPAVPIQRSKLCAGFMATTVARPLHDPGWSLLKPVPGAGPIGNQLFPWMAARTVPVRTRVARRSHRTAQESRPPSLNMILSFEKNGSLRNSRRPGRAERWTVPD